MVHDEIARVVSSPSPAKDSLFVTHGGIVRVLLRDVFEVGGEERIRVWNSSITQVDVTITKLSDPTPRCDNKNIVFVGGAPYLWR